MAKVQKKSAYQIEQEKQAEVIDWHRAELPEDDEGLVEEFGACLERYHDAAIAGDEKVMANEILRMKAAVATVWHCPAGEQYKGDERFSCWMDAAEWLLEQTAALDGEVPMYGQKGRFMLMIGGCRTDFHYAGLFGICGGDAHVVDLDRPFFSETGYRSFQVCPHDRILHTGGMLPDAYLRSVCEAQLLHGGGDKRKEIRLHDGPFGGGTWRGNAREPRNNLWILERRKFDPAWQKGGHLTKLHSLTAEGIGFREEKSGQLAMLF